MNWKEHLWLNAIIIFLVDLVMRFGFGATYVTWELLGPILLTWFIFSQLPDIDHAATNISWILIAIAVVSLIRNIPLLLETKELIFLWYVVVALAYICFWMYITTFENNHKNLPHTYTFGIIIGLIWFWLNPHWTQLLTAWLCFFGHLAADNCLQRSQDIDPIFGKQWKYRYLRWYHSLLYRINPKAKEAKIY